MTICILLSVTHLYSNTTLFFKKTSPKPIQIFFSESQAIHLSNFGILQKYEGIKSVDISIKNLFSNDYSEFQVHHNNFTEEEDFWFYTGNDNEEQYNRAKVDQYTSTHIPDYLIQASFIRDGSVPVWSQVWHSQPVIFVATNSFLHQTSFGVWEGEYFFDDEFLGITAYGDFYLKANVEQIIFRITIPDGYYLENADSYKLGISNNAIILAETLTAGESLHVVLKDKQAENIRSLIGFLHPLTIGILLGLVAQPIWDKFTKEKHVQQKKRPSIR